MCGAAPQRTERVYLSSDEKEELDDLSVTSILDLQLSSEDEAIHDEILMMAQCVEMELSAPISVPGPSTSKFWSNNKQSRPSRCELPNPDSFFSGEEMAQYDDLIRNNHPKKLHSERTPIVDTPTSPLPEDRGPGYNSFLNYAEYPQQQQHSLDLITNHFQRMEFSRNGPLTNCSDCVICGKSTMQIQREAVSDYLKKTATPGETALQVEARKRAFIERMQVGTFFLIPGGVSQAAACDGKFYTIDQSLSAALSGTLPIDLLSLINSKILFLFAIFNICKLVYVFMYLVQLIFDNKLY